MTAATATVVAVGCRPVSLSHLRSVERADAWVTLADQSALLAPLTVQLSLRDGASNRRNDAPVSVTISVDTALTYQRMEGFGGALTDASVSVLTERLPAAAREALLQDLFSPTVGIGLSALRITLGASDFSPVPYTYDDVPSGRRDTSLAGFSIGVDLRDKLPLLRRIRTINPALTLMATPWSAPAWMKSSGTLLGGTLRDDAVLSYAAYLSRVVDAYRAEGVPLDLLSVQNEPQHAPADYPGMRLSPAQRASLIRAVGPLLRGAGAKPALLEWDHNWDQPSEALEVLADAEARRYVHGVAWHCYAGDVEAQSKVHDAFPEIATYFTECSGGQWASNWGDNLLWNVRTLIIGATRHWARTVMLWNLALDDQHGPHRGGCNDCRGVVTVDASGNVARNEEYYALAHASRFVHPGAVRVASTGRTRAGGATVEHVAYRDPNDGATIVLLCNSLTKPTAVTIAGWRQTATLTMPARSVVTLRLH